MKVNDAEKKSFTKCRHLDFVMSGDHGTIKPDLLLFESSLENFAQDSSRKWNCSFDWLKSGEECGSNVSSRPCKVAKQGSFGFTN